MRIPDLSARPFGLVAEHVFALQPAALYHAWTAGSISGERHSQAWPSVLTYLEERITNTNTR